MSSGATRVLIAEDEALIRLDLKEMLEEEGYVVVAEVGDGQAAVEQAQQLRPDLVVLDVQMPVLDGIAATTAIAGDPALAAVRVIVLTTFDDDELVLRALRAGARGYLLKDVTLEQLLGGIRTVASGGTLLQPAMTDRLLRAAARRTTSVAGLERPEPLTDRELDVLRLLAEGYSNQAIATELVVAVGPVKRHVANIMGKLEVHSRLQVLVRARELDLL